MKIISDMDDASYFEKRAVELIHDAGVARLWMTEGMLATDKEKYDEAYREYHTKLNKAIQLIALARVEQQ